MGISKVTRNFQVTLPRDVRDAKNIRVGDVLVFMVKNDCIDVVKRDDKALADAAGLWSDFKGSSVDYVRRLRKEWDRRPRP